MHASVHLLTRTDFPRLTRRAVETLQLNLGYRCNLTILEEPGHEDLAAFLAAHGVEVVASLPCYQEDNVDRQRGKGSFEASFNGLRRLNALGYGRADSGLVLNLVYNPQGASLPPAQASLEADYKRYLGERYGVLRGTNLYGLVLSTAGFFLPLALPRYRMNSAGNAA